MSQSIAISATEPKKTVKKAQKGIKFPQPKVLTSFVIDGLQIDVNDILP